MDVEKKNMRPPVSYASVRTIDVDSEKRIKLLTRAHVLHRRLRHEERDLDVDIKVSVEVCLRDVLQHRVPHQPCGETQDVEVARAERLHALLDQPLRVGERGHVALDRDGLSLSLAGDARDDLLRRARVALVVHDDRRTVSGEPPSDSSADAARGAGDDSDFSCEWEGHCEGNKSM